MVGHVDCCIMEAVQAATGVDFDTEVMTKEELRLPARMKGGGIKRATDTRFPAFLGALLDILLRCVGRRENNGEVKKGTYADQLTEVIGEGAFDETGHRNTQFLRATTVGPYPREMRKAWEALREEAADDYGFKQGLEEEEDEARLRIGPLSEPTLAVVRNRGAAERKHAKRLETHTRERGEKAVGARREEGGNREVRGTQ